VKILSKNHSSYPRVGDEPKYQKLRRAYNQLDLGKITPAELALILDDTIEEVVNEQQATGCNLVTDGQIRAFDPLSYIAGKINGFEITGLLRFFDTNYLYRQPKVIGKLTYKESLITDDFAFIKKRANEKSSAVMFGPYSLLKMSNCENGFEDHLNELFDIYIKEIKALESVGAKVIQLDEPAIIHHPKDFDLITASYKKLKDAVSSASILLAFYFGNATPHLVKINEIPADGFIFDFTYSPGLDQALDGFDKDIGLGFIDSRNTKMERADDAAKQAEKLISKLKSDTAYITTSCGLEFLPRKRAFDKLKLCADVAGILRGGSR
jgi:5-methyltetrahydropteroyltriglutamate--homocysteine methyltransferase